MWQEAQRRGIAISDEQVSAHVGEVEAASGSPAIFERRLAEAGFDRAQYNDYTRHELAAQQVYALLSAVAAPSQPKSRHSMMPTGKPCKERSNKVTSLRSYANRGWSSPWPHSSGSGRRRRASPCANVCVRPLPWRLPTEARDGVSPMLGNKEMAVCHHFPRIWGTGRVCLPAALRVLIGALGKSMTYSGAA